MGRGGFIGGGGGGFISGGRGFISRGEESSSVAERRVRRCGRGGFISGEMSVWVKSSSLEDRSVTTEVGRGGE